MENTIRRTFVLVKDSPIFDDSEIGTLKKIGIARKGTQFALNLKTGSHAENLPVTFHGHLHLDPGPMFPMPATNIFVLPYGERSPTTMSHARQFVLWADVRETTPAANGSALSAKQAHPFFANLQKSKQDYYNAEGTVNDQYAEAQAAGETGSFKEWLAKNKGTIGGLATTGLGLLGNLLSKAGQSGAQGAAPAPPIKQYVPPAAGTPPKVNGMGMGAIIGIAVGAVVIIGGIIFLVSHKSAAPAAAAPVTV
jgi:hypothetical protein